MIGLDASDAVLASAKNGIGIKDILEAVVRRVPAPKGDPNAPLRALIFDSWFDPYRGVIILTRIVDGRFAKVRRSGSGRTAPSTKSKVWASNRRSRCPAMN